VVSPVTVIVMVSGKGSPGVSCSALALALAWPVGPRPGGGDVRPDRIVVLEADPSGSSAAAGYLQGRLDPGVGLASLTSATSEQIGARLPAAVIPIENQPDRYLLAGLSTPMQMAAQHQLWPALTHWLAAASRSRTDVVVDLGRTGAAYEPTDVFGAADLVLVVCRTRMPSVLGAVNAASQVRALTASGAFTGRMGCLLVGEHDPYCRAEVEDVLQVPVVGVLAWDPDSAAVFSDGAFPQRGFGRGPLMRSASAVAAALVARFATMPSRDGVSAGHGDDR
jgi:hypothetical protein